MEEWVDYMIIVLFAGWLLQSVYRQVQKIFGDHDVTVPGHGQWIPTAPYTHIVRETIGFCGGILHESGIRHFPSFTIRYYRHKKNAGVFNGEVVIYLKSNADMEFLVNTTLHEVRHYMQSVTDKQYKKYDDLTRDYGYWNNPLEVDARSFADRYTRDALKHLESKQLIIRR